MTLGRDLYLLHGWRVGPEDLKGLLGAMTPEILETGLRVVFGRASSQGAFVGDVLARTETDNGPEFAGASPPDAPSIEKLRLAMRGVGLQSVAEAEHPKIWAIMG